MMRSFAQFMIFGGVLLFLLAAFSQTGHLTAASGVADVLAMGTSLLASAAGLVYLLVTRETQCPRETQCTRGETR